MTIEEKYKTYNQTLDKYMIEIKNNRNNYNELVTTLNSLYIFLKVISIEYYKDNKKDRFTNVINKVHQIEDKVPDYFITESTPIFNYQKERKELAKINTKNNEEIYFHAMGNYLIINNTIFYEKNEGTFTKIYDLYKKYRPEGPKR